MTQDDPAFPVREQLEAYNRRDIEAFMRWWAEDCLYYAFPDRLLANGYAKVRERHVERFSDETLSAVLISRTVVGDFVIDTERVRRRFDGVFGEADVVGIYAVKNRRIQRAWFIQGPVLVAGAFKV